MKYFIPLIAIFLFINCATKLATNENEILINSTSFTSIGNKSKMKISRLISDSRCPVGANCAWAGEVQLEITIENPTKEETLQTLFISAKKLEQNKEFFANYLSANTKIKDIFILPLRKQKQEITPSDYVLKVLLE